MRWRSPINPKDGSKAVFLEYDPLSPKDAILVVPIGKFKQAFRWPLRLIEPLVD